MKASSTTTLDHLARQHGIAVTFFVMITCMAAAACTRGPKIPDSELQDLSAGTPAEQGTPRGAEHAEHPPVLPPGHPDISADHGDDPHEAVDPHHAEQAHPPSSRATSTSAGLPSVGGVVWNPPRLFVSRAPSSSMRAAEYSIAGEETDAASLAVFYFGAGQGGDVQGNIDRWIGQFSAPDGSTNAPSTTISKKTIGGMQVSTLDVSGTFEPGPMVAAGAKASTQSNYRLLGAIAEGPQGPVFFKLTGPKKTVDRAETAFAALVNSLHRDK